MCRELSVKQKAVEDLTTTERLKAVTRFTEYPHMTGLQQHSYIHERRRKKAYDNHI